MLLNLHLPILAVLQAERYLTFCLTQTPENGLCKVKSL